MIKYFITQTIIKLLILAIISALIHISCCLSPRKVMAQDDADYSQYNGNPVWSPDGDSIAFVSGRSGNLDIWLMEVDGSSLKNLTSHHPGPDIAPVWSLDGLYIAYLSVPEETAFYDVISRVGYYDVWVMEKDGTNPINLTASFSGKSGEYQWSPDGKHIALISEDINENFSNIWIMEPTGANPINLTSSDEHLFGSLTWSPSGEVIAFTAANIDPVQRDGVWYLELKSPIPVPLTSERNDVAAVWSPTGDYLALTTLLSDGSGLYDIWRVDADGENLTNLTPHSPELDWNPVWSPDGQFIAFETNRNISDTGRDIWVMEADGSNPVNLTGDLHEWSIRPNWSPDGTQLAFESYWGDYTVIGLIGESDIWIVNADGSSPINLTTGHR